jgi:arylsulfatase A-like enzyme
MNVILFLTDQERAIQHFPAGWAEKNLPGMARLQQNGLTFHRAFTNSCMCSPARGTMMTGLFPAQHGVKWTLEENMSDPEKYPQQELPLDLANLATVMKAAGYATPYKGKFHIMKPQNADGIYTPADLARYGFERWNPTDAGANQDPKVYGGGDANHDSRYMHDCRLMEDGDEGVLAYLKTQAAAESPFFLVVSLVNPHDVLGYPAATGALANGYTDEWLCGDIELPPTVVEDLSTKPKVQSEFLKIMDQAMGTFANDRERRKYLNFYGNLMRSSDRYLLRTIDLLEQLGMLDSTLIIRAADHGEMGLAHNGLRQKNFNFYEEAIRVPLVYSNPQLFPSAASTNALVSHVDLLPTLATLFESPVPTEALQGIDYSSIVLDPSAPRVQDYIVFTYDDYQSGQASDIYPRGANHIVSIREERYKLAKYYNLDHPRLIEWEMYDLHANPQETDNLAHQPDRMDADTRRHFDRLRAKLEEVEKTRLS